MEPLEKYLRRPVDIGSNAGRQKYPARNAQNPDVEVLKKGLLFTALFFCFIAAAIEVRENRSALFAGIFLGLTWLTRSQVMLALPPLLFFFCLKLPWKQAVRRFLVIAVLGAAVASPWLWRTKQVFGSFLHSEDSYYLIQDIEAKAFQTEGVESRKSFFNSVERYWHSTEAPSGLLAIVKQDPKAFLTHVASQLGNVAGATLFDQVGRRRLLLLGSVAIIGCLAFWRLYAPETIATALYAATLISVFAIRGQSFEPRYAGTLHVVFGLLAAAGCVHIVRQITSRVRGKAAQLAAVTVFGLLVGGVIAERISVTSSRLYRRLDGRVEYEAIAREANERFGKGKPVVVGTKPYFYSRVTGSSALSIPEASDAYLKSYMEKYEASFVLLTPEELDLWRPNWKLKLPSFLKPEGRIRDAYIYQRVTSDD